MIKLAKKYTWLTAMTAAFALVILLGAASVPVHAQPGIPAQFYGYAYINGALAANGKTVVAKVNGVQVGSTTCVTATGYNYNMQVSGPTSGDTIVFFIDSVQATPTSVYYPGYFNGSSSPGQPPFNLYTYTTVLGVTTGTATGIFSTAALLAGTLTGLGASPSVNVSFEYGLTTAYGYSTVAQSMSAAGGYTTGITGLAPSSTYHFRARATDGGSTVYGTDSSFTTLTPTLTVTTGSSSSVTTSTATMTGSLTDLGTNSSVSVSFDYGTTTSYGTTTTPQTRTTTGDFSATISGLTAGTIYHYRAKAAGATTATGSDMTFTTSSASSGCTSGCCHWLWGTAYLNGTALNTGTVIARVNGSQAATTTTNTAGGYNFYVPVTAGSTVTFTVGGATAAQSLTGQCMGYNGSYNLYATTGTVSVSTGSSTYATTTTSVLGGSLGSLGSDSSATVSLEYGTTTAYGTTTSTTLMSSTGTFTGGASGLTAGTTYHFRAKAVGSPSGTIVYGSDVSFVHNAGGSLAVSTTGGSYATATTATFSGNLTSLGSDASATVSFEYGLTTGYGSATSTSSVSSTGSYAITATGLVAGTTYHMRAKAVGNTSGSTVYGSDVTYVHSSGGGSLAVSTTGGTYLTTTTATFTGNLTGLGTDTSATVSFEYGPTTGYGSTTSTSSVSSVGSYAITATGLVAGTTYHMRAKAVGSPSASTVYGSDVTYTHNSGICGSDPVGCTVGEFCTTVMPFWIYASRYTATGSATIDQINVRSNGTGNMKVAIYSDSFNSVGTLIAGSTGEGAVTAGLNSIPLDSPVTITAGTAYWLAEWSDARIFSFTLEPGVYANSNAAYASFDFSTATISWLYPTPGTHRGLISGSN